MKYKRKDTASFIVDENGKVAKIKKKSVLKVGTAILLVGLAMGTIGLIQTSSARAQCWIPPGGGGGVY